MQQLLALDCLLFEAASRLPAEEALDSALRMYSQLARREKAIYHFVETPPGDNGAPERPAPHMRIILDTVLAPGPRAPFVFWAIKSAGDLQFDRAPTVPRAPAHVGLDGVTTMQPRPASPPHAVAPDQRVGTSRSGA